MGTLFSAICRTFRSGGTRIRTWDTIIFSHIPRLLGMRICRVGKRIYVQGVPVGTRWFCPYCCATVDTALFTLRGSGSTPVDHGVLVLKQHSYTSLISVPTASHPESTCAGSLMGLPPLAHEPADQQQYPHDHQPQGPPETVETKTEPADADNQLEEKRPHHEERRPNQR